MKKNKTARPMWHKIFLWNWIVFTIQARPPCYDTSLGQLCGNPCGSGRWMKNNMGKPECRTCPPGYYIPIDECEKCTGTMTNLVANVRRTCKDQIPVPSIADSTTLGSASTSTLFSTITPTTVTKTKVPPATSAINDADINMTVQRTAPNITNDSTKGQNDDATQRHHATNPSNKSSVNGAWIASGVVVRLILLIPTMGIKVCAEKLHSRKTTLSNDEASLSADKDSSETDLGIDSRELDQEFTPLTHE